MHGQFGKDLGGNGPCIYYPPAGTSYFTTWQDLDMSCISNFICRGCVRIPTPGTLRCPMFFSSLKFLIPGTDVQFLLLKVPGGRTINRVHTHGKICLTGCDNFEGKHFVIVVCFQICGFWSNPLFRQFSVWFRFGTCGINQDFVIFCCPLKQFQIKIRSLLESWKMQKGGPDHIVE